MEPVPIKTSTRVVLTLDLIFSLVAGIVLYALSTRTADYFAWTIKLPLTAAFLGAGYLGAVATLIPSYRSRDWREIRIIPVMGFTLTFVTLIVTLWHLGQFHLGAGAVTARVAGWAWLFVYAVIPVLLAAVFVVQERARGGTDEVAVEPLLPLARTALTIQALLTTVLGVGLVLAPGTFDVVWSWFLPPLPAGAVGAWLLTIATGSWWSLREGDWARFRSGVPGLVVFFGLIVIGAIRYSGPLAGGSWQLWVFFSALALSAATFAIAAYQQHRQACRLAGQPTGLTEARERRPWPN